MLLNRKFHSIPHAYKIGLPARQTVLGKAGGVALKSYKMLTTAPETSPSLERISV